MTTPITAQAEALHLVLTSAREHDMPEPTLLYMGNATGRIQLFLASLADLTAWAMWAEAAIEDFPHQGSIQHHAKGAIYDVPVELVFVERAAVSA